MKQCDICPADRKASENMLFRISLCMTLHVAQGYHSIDVRSCPHPLCNCHYAIVIVHCVTSSSCVAIHFISAVYLQRKPCVLSCHFKCASFCNVLYIVEFCNEDLLIMDFFSFATEEYTFTSGNHEYEILG